MHLCVFVYMCNMSVVVCGNVALLDINPMCTVCGLEFSCNLMVLIFGSFALVHKVARILGTASLPEASVKQLARHYSISAVIGTMIVWQSTEGVTCTCKCPLLWACKKN